MDAGLLLRFSQSQVVRSRVSMIHYPHKVIQNCTALDYVLAGQGGVFAIANTSYCAYINISCQFEISVEKIDHSVPGCNDL